jgi:iron-sulfur cluster assembly accessory protein
LEKNMTFPEEITISPVTFTQTAANAVRQVMTQKNLQGYALRLFISGSGCSGYQYGLAMDSNIRAEDVVTDVDGIKLVVDEVSIKYLQGASVDYIEGEGTSGFRISNPNAVSSCSCGQSSDSSAGGASEGCSGCG